MDKVRKLNISENKNKGILKKLRTEVVTGLKYVG
jgi:hypothetical protein